MNNNIIHRNDKKSEIMHLSVELFILFVIVVFVVQNWVFVAEISFAWRLVISLYSIISLLPILLVSTEFGDNFLKSIFGKTHIGLKFCSALTLLIGSYILLGKLSFEGFYILMGIKIAGIVYKYTPFAFVIIFAIFFMISNTNDSVDYSEKVKITDIIIVIILFLFMITTNFATNLECTYLSLVMRDLHKGIAALIYFPQLLCQWEYLNLPLVIFFIQRNYDRSIFGFTFHLTWRDIKTILKGMLLFIGLTILIGLVSERIIYIPYDRLSLKLWVNKIYYAVFVQGVTEEFIYRALILTVIDKLLREKNCKNGSIIAVLISALVYALSYWRAGIVSILTMFLVGMVLSYSYYSTKKFAVPVLLNAFWVIISSEWSKVVL